MAYDVTDFDAEVIERSHEIPVVVDFWAAWCGPCKAFAPVLEQAADQADGKWVLAKVNTQELPEIGEQQGIRSLPTLRVFRNGEPIAEKIGAMSAPEFHEWLAPNLDKSEADKAADDKIDLIREHIGDGNFAAATVLLEAVIKEQPGNEEIKFMRIQAALAMEPARVAELARDLEGTAYQERCQYLKELAELVIKGGDGDFSEGLDLLTKIKLPEAAAKWISVLEADRNHEGAKSALKNLFLYLGRDHAVTDEYQPKFSSILFS